MHTCFLPTYTYLAFPFFKFTISTLVCHVFFFLSSKNLSQYQIK
jgi:hypothetical protein